MKVLLTIDVLAPIIWFVFAAVFGDRYSSRMNAGEVVSLLAFLAFVASSLATVLCFIWGFRP